MESRYGIRPVGYVESPLVDRMSAPKQGSEGAPDAWLVFEPDVSGAVRDLAAGTDVFVLTWLHEARRDVLAVHPRSDPAIPETGVFSTRSPDRPNPIGLHRVRVLAVDGLRVRVHGLEAVHGTPVVDVKPVIAPDEQPATTEPAPPRPLRQRITDTRYRLERDVDVWVSTAGADGSRPYLVPLSFLWDGETLLIATAAGSPTARNLCAGGRVRLGLGPTRDVVLVEGTAAPVPPGELPAEVGDAFAVRTGFDPRELSSPYLYFRIRPRRIQAWREENELAGRDLMRDGRWLAG